MSAKLLSSFRLSLSLEKSCYLFRLVKNKNLDFKVHNIITTLLYILLRTVFFWAKILSDTSKADELTQMILKVISEQTPQSVKQLTTILKEDLGLTEEKILESVLILLAEKKIKLGGNFLEFLNFKSYLMTGGSIWFWVILAVEVMTVFMVFTISETFYPWFYLRNFFGVIFVLLLPGYAFTKALFPISKPNKSSNADLENIIRIALSVGMSLGLVSIIGLSLYYSPWGLELIAIVLCLFVFTLVFSTTAVFREYLAKKIDLTE